METSEEIESRYRHLIDTLDNVTAEIYSLGGFDERLAFMSKIRDLIIEKDVANDQVAVDVLNWAWERLAEVD